MRAYHHGDVELKVQCGVGFAILFYLFIFIFIYLFIYLFLPKFSIGDSFTTERRFFFLTRKAEGFSPSMPFFKTKKRSKA
jgi:hypothetical protein